MAPTTSCIMITCFSGVYSWSGSESMSVSMSVAVCVISEANNAVLLLLPVHSHIPSVLMDSLSTPSLVSKNNKI